MYLFALIASVIIFFALAVFYSSRPGCNIFHPLTLYLAFHGLVFVIRPWFAWYYDYSLIYRVYDFIPSEADKIATLGVTNLGLVAFAAASLWFGREPFRFNWAQTETDRQQSLVKPLAASLALLAPLAVYSLYLVWVDRAAGSLGYDVDLATGTTVNVSGNGYAKEAQLMLISATLIVAWLGRFRFLSLIPLALFVFFRAGTGGRGPIMIALFGLACFYLYERRKQWFDWRVLAATAVAVLIFNAIGLDRGAGLRDFVSGDDVASLAPTVDTWDEIRLAPMEGMDLGNLEFAEFLVHTVPEKTGSYEYFTDQLQIFTEPVPRAIWQDKPIGQPVRLFNLFDYGFPIGMTRSLPGEGWTQLGYAGVLLWCGLWGGVLGALYSAFMRSKQTVFQIASYFCFVPLLIIFYRDGYPITLLRTGIFVFAPIALWKLLALAMVGEQGRPMARSDNGARPERNNHLRAHRKGADENALAPRARRGPDANRS